MLYVENIFVCLVAPIVVLLFVVNGSRRQSIFAVIFGMVACLLAAWHSGMDPVFACVGAVAGYFISGNYVFGSTCLLMGAGIWLLNSKRKIRRIYRLLLAFGAETLLNLIFALIFGKNVLLMAGSATVSVFGAVVIASGIHGMRSLLGGRALNDTELLTLSAVIGLLTFSMRSFNIFGQSPAVIFSAACALFLADRLGIPAVAAAITAGAGHILATNSDLHFVAALASATLITASLRPLGKMGLPRLLRGDQLLLYVPFRQ